MHLGLIRRRRKWRSLDIAIYSCFFDIIFPRNCCRHFIIIYNMLQRLANMISIRSPEWMIVGWWRIAEHKSLNTRAWKLNLDALSNIGHGLHAGDAHAAGQKQSRNKMSRLWRNMANYKQYSVSVDGYHGGGLPLSSIERPTKGFSLCRLQRTVPTSLVVVVLFLLLCALK